MTCSFAKEFSNSAFTSIENAFIKEYLPIASGESVKVYLYGLFACQNPAFDVSIKDMADFLKLSEETVKDCFYFWEEFGLVSILSKEPFSVQYQPITTTSSARPKKIKAEKYSEFTKSIQVLLPTRMISPSEYTEYFMIMETFAIKPEAMLLIIKYCIDKKGKEIGYRYISKVAKDFGSRGITTVEKIEKELSSYVLRTGEINKILSAMSLKRQPEIEDLALLKKWTTELGFELDNIVFAASSLKKGSMAKLDELIMQLFSMKRFSKEEISSYTKEKKFAFELAIKINKALSIYMEVVDTVVDNYTNKWLSFGYEEQTLMYIANYCFRSNKNTLEQMDELIEKLYQRGFITLSSVSDYFESIKRTNEFISKLLSVCGVNRKPTDWDRENLNMWKSWNFSEDMILEAGKLSSGKSSPISYMNGILSNWKNKEVYTLDNISTSKTDSSIESYNLEYERRRTAAISRAQTNMEKAMEIDEFSKIYQRLLGIEKDLAFAEINGDDSALAKLEEEKNSLVKNQAKVLSTIGLTIEDLSPKYKCTKCNDTGYVGTEKCDCFNK